MTLEPCPFCGGEAEWRDDPGVCDVPFGLVVAHKDHCFLNHIAFEEADIISAWSTRAPDSRIAALEAEVARKDEALRAKPWPPSDSELAEMLASIVEVWWSPSTANLIRAGKRSPTDIKGMYAVRDAMAPYVASAALEARND